MSLIDLDARIQGVLNQEVRKQVRLNQLRCCCSRTPLTPLFLVDCRQQMLKERHQLLQRRQHEAKSTTQAARERQREAERAAMCLRASLLAQKAANSTHLSTRASLDARIAAWQRRCKNALESSKRAFDAFTPLPKS